MGVRDRIATSITDIQNRGKRLIQLNVELLTAELKRKGQQFGAAIGLFVAAGVVALYAIGFALATIAVALYIVLPLWLALLIVTAALFLIVLILALVGRSRLKAAQQSPTIKPADEARKSLDFAKAQVRETAQAVVPKRSSVTLTSRQGASWSPPPPPAGSSGPLVTKPSPSPGPAVAPSAAATPSEPPAPSAPEAPPSPGAPPESDTTGAPPASDTTGAPPASDTPGTPPPTTGGE